MAVSTKETDCVGEIEGVAEFVAVSVAVGVGVDVGDCEGAWDPLCVRDTLGACVAERVSVTDEVTLWVTVPVLLPVREFV